MSNRLAPMPIAVPEVEGDVVSVRFSEEDGFMARHSLCGKLLLMVLIAAATSCDFFVDPAPVSIAVSPPAPSLLAGAKQQFQASCTYDNGSTDMLDAPAWTSSNAGVIYVNASGMATAISQGSASISATWKGISGSTTVSVVTSPLNKIEVTPINPLIYVSQATQQFAATGTFADGTVADITAGVAWSSSDTSVATISNSGLATALGKEGTTVIQAASGNIKASSTLTVRQVGSGTGGI